MIENQQNVDQSLGTFSSTFLRTFGLSYSPIMLANLRILNVVALKDLIILKEPFLFGVAMCFGTPEGNYHMEKTTVRRQKLRQFSTKEIAHRVNVISWKD